jgi:hypothetical protein
MQASGCVDLEKAGLRLIDGVPGRNFKHAQSISLEVNPKPDEIWHNRHLCLGPGKK